MTGAALVDLSSAAQGRQHLWLDGLDPNRSGAALIARAVAQALSSRAII